MALDNRDKREAENQGSNRQIDENTGHDSAHTLAGDYLAFLHVRPPFLNPETYQIQRIGTSQ